MKITKEGNKIIIDGLGKTFIDYNLCEPLIYSNTKGHYSGENVLKHSGFESDVEFVMTGFVFKKIQNNDPATTNLSFE